MTIDQSIENMTIQSFVSSLSDDEKEIVALKGMGYKNREIARQLGISDVNVTRSLNRMKNQYKKFVS